MQTDAYRLWSTRIVTFAVSGLAAASLAFWSLKNWSTVTPPTALAVVSAPVSPVTPQAVARALGGAVAPAASGAQAPPPAISRYSLVGVVAGRTGAGAALISTDGQEAKPVRIGGLVSEGMVLQSVTGRRAVLASSGTSAASLTLELPPLDN